MIDASDVALEMARTEREAISNINKRISEQQRGELWAPGADEFSEFFAVYFPKFSQTR